MNGRRLLGDTLGEIVGGVIDAQGGLAHLMRVNLLELELPIDVRVAIDPEGPVVVGDVPLMRTRSDFDPPPVQLKVKVETLPGEAS